MRIQEKSAESAYQKARLDREIAEIAVVEYKEGVYVQALASVEGEIKAAREGIGTARRLKDAVAQQDQEDLLGLYERNDRLSLYACELKKRALTKYKGPRRIKELKAEAARARAVELVKEAEWKLLAARRKQAQDVDAGPRGRPDAERHSLALLERGSLREQRVRADLARYVEKDPADGALRKEILRLTNELEAIAADADAASAADDFAALRPRIRQAARRLGVAGP